MSLSNVARQRMLTGSYTRLTEEGQLRSLIEKKKKKSNLQEPFPIFCFVKVAKEMGKLLRTWLEKGRMGVSMKMWSKRMSEVTFEDVGGTLHCNHSN